MSERSAGPVGIVLGVVLLGAVAAFGIALPKVVDDGGSDDAQALELPDTLPHGLVAQDASDGPDAERFAEFQESAVAGFEEIYGDQAAVRGYATEDGSVQATVTVLERAPGLFNPHGPPIDPALLGFERSLYELRRVGDAVCDLGWEQIVPEGEAIDDTVAPRAVMCQLGDGERTLEIFASGLGAEESVEVLESLVDG